MPSSAAHAGCRRVYAAYTRLLTVACTATLSSAFLTGCAGGDNEDGAEVLPPDSAQDEATTASINPSLSESESAVATSSLSSSVQEVREIFSTLAPDSFFERLDTCESGTLLDSWECAGEEIGSFTFTDSASTASRTASALTELRSSHVVEDDGSRIVGWSTMAGTTVITVVDTEEGTVMRKLIDDRTEPEDILRELELADAATLSSAAASTASETTSSTATTSGSSSEPTEG